ncbi:MAG: hypothetical protein EON47_17875 [Acetobacteraceae bacterium]|nr:MAG: hypothetical protein EON47_17875 [Acetobacteraceae bacterium]
MPEGVDLKAARRFVAGQDRVSARLLMDVFRLEQRAALQMVQDMERLGDIARPDDSGWHAVLARDAEVPPPAEPDGLAAADWRQRAEAAEARLAAGTQDEKFDRLKRRLAREFHPDQAAPSEIDRVVREVVFRRLWQIVQEVENA